MNKDQMKRIKSHPGVAEVNDGPALGFDYKINVVLKEGWCWGYGRTAGCQECNFNTYKDFTFAEPMTVKDYEAHDMKNRQIKFHPDSDAPGSTVKEAWAAGLGRPVSLGKVSALMGTKLVNRGRPKAR